MAPSPEPQNNNHTTTLFAAAEDNAAKERIVVVRYFLDRPGYDLQNSSARLWKDPPKICKAADVRNFLEAQGIVGGGDKQAILIEVFLDKYHSFMLLEACEADAVQLDFSHASVQHPDVLNIRLTDTTSSGFVVDAGTAQQPQRQICSTVPVGLFAFSMTVGLEAAGTLSHLVDGSVDPSFVLTWAPYAFFVSGLLQLIVGLWEVTRNNIYGAYSMIGFELGCFSR